MIPAPPSPEGAEKMQINPTRFWIALVLMWAGGVLSVRFVPWLPWEVNFVLACFLPVALLILHERMSCDYTALSIHACGRDSKALYVTVMGKTTHNWRCRQVSTTTYDDKLYLDRVSVGGMCEM